MYLKVIVVGEEPMRKDLVQNRLFRSVKLWALCCDLEESLGTTASTRACYDATLELKVGL